MALEKRDLKTQPELAVTEKYDAIWVLLPATRPAPFKHAGLQWIDWKMRGQLSRWILSEKVDGATDTVFPTMERFATPYVIVQRGREPKFQSLVAASVGMKHGKVLLISEGGWSATDLEQTLRKHKAASETPHVVLGVCP